MAKVIWRVVGHELGIESNIRAFGIFYMVVGIIGAVGFTIVYAIGETTEFSAGLYSSSSITIHNPIYLALALASLLSAFFPYAVLAGIAELLRVQKRAAGLPFAGVMRMPTVPIWQPECEACKNAVRKGDSNCPNCKQPLEWPETSK